MLTETIVAISENNHSYIDELFYKKMEGDDDATTYPVKMKLVEVGWMIKKGGKHGLKFLQAILASENNDLYDTDTIKITIEYLYMKYSRKVLFFLLPVYILTVLFFLATLFYFELVEDERDWAKTNKRGRDNKNKLLVQPDDERLNDDYGKGWMMVIGSFNFIMTVINIAVFYVKSRKSYETYWFKS